MKATILLQCNDRSLCYCEYACNIKEESQPLMQDGHWCRRKRKNKLRAYNRTNIPQLGALDTDITWKDYELYI